MGICRNKRDVIDIFARVKYSSKTKIPTSVLVNTVESG